MIVQIKSLINSNTSQEMVQYFKEQLVSLYNQLSECHIEKLKNNDFIDFVNRSNVFLFVNEKMKIIGAITALYERKLIHNGGVICHIEDFVVDEQYRGKDVGKALMNFVIQDAKKKKVYKIILDCDKKMQRYYEKYNFEYKNIQMAMYM